MKTSTNICLKATEFVTSCSTRSFGAKLREVIERELTHCEGIELDLENRLVTPSFADECFGVFAEAWGANGFKSRVKILNASKPSQLLIAHVVGRRSIAHRAA